MEVFFRELEQEEIAQIVKKAAEKVNLPIEEQAVNELAMYARNGREAVNTLQIAAGIVISEKRSKILRQDIEWVIQSSQLSPRYEKKVGQEAKIGLVNGLAVYTK